MNTYNHKFNTASCYAKEIIRKLSTDKSRKSTVTVDDFKKITAFTNIHANGRFFECDGTFLPFFVIRKMDVALFITVDTDDISSVLVDMNSTDYPTSSISILAEKYGYYIGEGTRQLLEEIEDKLACLLW